MFGNKFYNKKFKGFKRKIPIDQALVLVDLLSKAKGRASRELKEGILKEIGQNPGSFDYSWTEKEKVEEKKRKSWKEKMKQWQNKNKIDFHREVGIFPKTIK